MNTLLIRLLLVLSIFFFNRPLAAEPIELTWDDLYRTASKGVKMNLDPTATIRGIPDISEFGGSSEQLNLFFDDVKFMKRMQPEGVFINKELNGKEIRIPGFITPIAFDGQYVTEFLFAPFRGACIHVPPPPANQIIYVKSAMGLKVDTIWDPKWITGILHAKAVSTLLADVGYSIHAASVAPYRTDVNLFDLLK